MQSTLKGTGVALVTPFTADHAVDYPALQRLLRHVGEGGVEYLVVLGTTGESATLSKEEKRDVLSFVVRHNERQLPVVYGLGGNNTHEVLDTITHTDFTGVTAILSVSPYYNKPSQLGIYEHYRRVADACPVPVILYNVPGRTGSNVSAATTLKLSKHPNIVGIKEASTDWTQVLEIAKGIHASGAEAVTGDGAGSNPGDFLLICGDDLLALPTISVGGIGVISVVANAFPADFSRLVRHALAGEYGPASRQLYRFLAVNPLLYEEANPVGVKKVLEMAGVCGAHVRLPLWPASDDLSARLQKAIRKEGLLDMTDSEAAKPVKNKKSAWL
ncbi:MAG: 4-hydroxy-tetrahydrodipicolinate synthase [Ferruginibacter sp.]|nr:4-hydroxy-tetrahydrodipicolinate synthase [Cytophagales bacterium]